jgi:hypothetical protein
MHDGSRPNSPASEQGVPFPAASRAASPSMAPVGLELSDADILEEEAPRAPIQQTGSIRVPKRRRLGGIVIGAVAGCGLILLAAVIAKVSRASGAPRDPTVALAAPPPPVQPAGAATAPEPQSPPGVAAVGPADSSPPTTGTLRLQRPAAPGRVWLDGKKVTSSSVLVQCGPHQLKVGARARARAIQIPCGGDIAITK